MKGCFPTYNGVRYTNKTELRKAVRERYNNYKKELGTTTDPFKSTVVKEYMYHGGSIDMSDVFREEFQKDESKYLKGFFFTNDPETAKGYASHTGNIRKVVINAKKLLEVRDTDSNYIKINRDNPEHALILNAIDEKLGDDADKLSKIKNLMSYIHRADKLGVDVKEILTSLGYDGLILTPKPGEVYGPFGKKKVVNEVGQRQVIAFKDNMIVDESELIQGTKEVVIKSKYHFSVNGFVYDRLNKSEVDSNGLRHTPINYVNGELKTHNFSVMDNFDLAVNMAIDNLKLQFFSKLNITTDTVDAFVGLLAVGIPFDTVITIINTPVFKSKMSRKAVIDSIKKESIKSAIEKQVMSDQYFPDFSIEDYDLGQGDITKLTDAQLVNYAHMLSAVERAKKIVGIRGKSAGLSAVSKAVTASIDTPGFFYELQEMINEFDSIFMIDGSNAQQERDEKKNLKREGIYVPKPGTKNQFQLKSSFAFENVQILTLPHILQAFRSLRFIKTRISNIWYKHNKDLTEFSQNVYSWIDKNGISIKLGQSKEDTYQQMNEEFMKYALSGITYDDGYTMSTFDEKPWEISGKKGEFHYGLEAWNQRHIEKVAKLKRMFPDNPWLSAILIQSNSNTTKGLSMPRISQMEPIEIKALSTQFEAFIEELIDEKGKWKKGFENIDRDFLKYASLNWGLGAGGLNYTQALPPSMFTESTKYLDAFLYKLYQKDKNAQDAFFSNIYKHFALQFAFNKSGNIFTHYTIRKNFVSGSGIDTVDGNEILYARKYKKDESKVWENFPTLLRDGGRFYYKIQDYSTTHVYYTSVGTLDYHQAYQYSPDVELSGYDPDVVFNGKYKLLSHDGLLDEKISMKIFNIGVMKTDIGSVVIMRQKSDISGINARYYTVESKNGNEVVLTRGDKLFSFEKPAVAILEGIETMGGANVRVTPNKSAKTKNKDEKGKYHQYLESIPTEMMSMAKDQHNKFMDEVRTFGDSIGIGKILSIVKGLKAKYPLLDIYYNHINEVFNVISTINEELLYGISQQKNIALDRSLENKLKNKLGQLFPQIKLSYDKLGINEKGVKILGLSDIQAMEVLLDYDARKQDTLPHEYVHHYIDWYEDTPIVQEAIQKWGSKENLVQAIGEQVVAQKGEAGTWWKNFSQWLGTIFENLLGRNKEELRNILTDALLSGASLVKDQSIETAIAKRGSGIEYQVADIIDTIERNNATAGIQLYDTNGENEYRNSAGNVYNRLTDWIYKNFSYSRNSKENVDRFVNELFTRRKSDIVNGKLDIRLDGVPTEFTSEEYKAFLNKHNENSRMSGNIMHLKIKMLLTNNPAEKREIDDKIHEMAREKSGVQDAISLKDFDFVDKYGTEILESIGSNYFNTEIDESEKDKVASEIILASDRFGLATTFDIVLQRKSGNLVVADWKSGPGFFKDNSPIFLKHGEWVMGSQLNDTKENRAKLEMAWRVLMLKDKFPTVQFDDIYIVHIDKTMEETEDSEFSDRITKLPVSMRLYLDLIEMYMLDPANGMKDIHKEFKQRGLFNSDNYGGDDMKVVTESDAKLTHSEQVEKYRNLVHALKMQLGLTKRFEQKNNLEKALKVAYDKLKSLYEFKGKDYDYDTHDLDAMKQHISLMQYDVSDPEIQTLTTEWNRSDQAKRAELRDLRDKLEDMMRPVIEEYNKTVPFYQQVTENNFGKYFTSPVYAKLFAFMWDWVDDGQRLGYYRSTGKTYTSSNKETRQMTDAQYAFNQYYHQSMEKLYNEIAGSEYRGMGSTMKTHTLLRIPRELPRDFMPRTPMTGAEIRERFGITSKEHSEHLKNYWKGLYTERRHAYHGARYMVPVKFMGSNPIIESGNYSIDAYNSYLAFMENLLHKKHFDPLVSWGNYLADVLHHKGKPRIEAILRNVVRKQFIRQRFEPDTGRVNVVQKERLKYNDETIEVEQEIISSKQIARTIKSMFTFTVMAGKLVGPVFNGAIATSLLIKDGVKAEVFKSWYIGDDADNKDTLKPTDIDYDMVSLGKAIMSWLNEIVWGFWMNKKDRKLALFAEQFNYLGEAFDFKIRRGSSLIGKARILNWSHGFLTYRIFEDFVSYTTLAAQLHHIKVTKNGKEISMYDAYEVQDGKLTYTGDKRGVYMTKAGTVESLYGLTPEEILKLKRIYQRVQGGYKDEEKLMIEDTFIGIFGLQFKRFLPAILNNAIGGAYLDKSLGSWVDMVRNGEVVRYKDPETGKEETVKEFQERLYQARVSLMWNIMKTGAQLTMNNFGKDNSGNINQQYRWSQLSMEQKQQVADLIATGGMVLMYAVLHGVIDEDPDKLTPLEIRLNRVFMEDLTQGLNPKDILRMFNQPAASVGKLLDLYDGMVKYFGEGVIEGKRTREGRMPGGATIRKSLPIVAVFAELDKYFKEDIKRSRFGVAMLGYEMR